LRRNCRTQGDHLGAGAASASRVNKDVSLCVLSITDKA